MIDTLNDKTRKTGNNALTLLQCWQNAVEKLLLDAVMRRQVTLAAELSHHQRRET